MCANEEKRAQINKVPQPSSGRVFPRLPPRAWGRATPGLSLCVHPLWASAFLWVAGIRRSAGGWGGNFPNNPLPKPHVYTATEASHGPTFPGTRRCPSWALLAPLEGPIAGLDERRVEVGDEGGVSDVPTHPSCSPSPGEMEAARTESVSGARGSVCPCKSVLR